MAGANPALTSHSSTVGLQLTLPGLGARGAPSPSPPGAGLGGSRPSAPASVGWGGSGSVPGAGMGVCPIVGCWSGGSVPSGVWWGAALGVCPIVGCCRGELQLSSPPPLLVSRGCQRSRLCPTFPPSLPHHPSVLGSLLPPAIPTPYPTNSLHPLFSLCLPLHLLPSPRGPVPQCPQETGAR